MKSASTALQNYINSVRAEPDAAITAPDCYILTLVTGVVLTWTNADYPIVYDGYTFSCTGPLVAGLKYKAEVGLNVDKQQITIAARATDLISGVMTLQAISQGAFDGAIIERHRVFLTAPGGTVIGGAMLFHGRVSTVDSVGRTRATVTVASDLITLDFDMPRNTFQPNCNHTLYDPGCGVVRGTWSATGNCGTGSTASTIVWTGASAQYVQGSIVFSSGQNANLRATVKSAVAATSLTLIYPLPETPDAGDAFTVACGCDHTANTCQGRFNNLGNFRGFPFVPPPELAY